MEEVIIKKTLNPLNAIKIYELQKREYYMYLSFLFYLIKAFIFKKTWIAKINNELAGFILLDHKYRITAICVKRKLRKKSIGSKLIQTVLQEVNKKNKVWLIANKNAIKFYEKNGFKLEKWLSSTHAIMRYNQSKKPFL